MRSKKHTYSDFTMGKGRSHRTSKQLLRKEKESRKKKKQLKEAEFSGGSQLQLSTMDAESTMTSRERELINEARQNNIYLPPEFINWSKYFYGRAAFMREFERYITRKKSFPSAAPDIRVDMSPPDAYRSRYATQGHVAGAPSDKFSRARSAGFSDMNDYEDWMAGEYGHFENPNRSRFVGMVNSNLTLAIPAPEGESATEHVVF